MEGPLTFPCFDLASDCPLSRYNSSVRSWKQWQWLSDAFSPGCRQLTAQWGESGGWLQPPSRAAMSRLHPLDVQSCSEARHCYDSAWVVEQEVGDVMYVPDMWGHAVLNSGATYRGAQRQSLHDDLKIPSCQFCLTATCLHHPRGENRHQLTICCFKFKALTSVNRRSQHTAASTKTERAIEKQ